LANAIVGDNARMLADAILLVHAAFVLFVAGGLVAVWIGVARGEAWARNRAFRIAHLAAIAFVAGESLLGIACPLTIWEDALRGRDPGAESFVGRAVRAALYWDLPEAVFTAAYVAFALLVAWTWWRWPPRRS
jgi:polyferredoxin